MTEPTFDDEESVPMREVGSDDFVGRAKYLNADGPRPTCCGRVWIFIKGVWMFLALVMAVAAMIWLGVYIQRHHKQVPGLRDTDREIEGSLMKFAIHSGELDGNFITKSFAVTCGEKKPCPKEVSIDVAFLPNSMVVLKFPPETYTCTPCSNPILNMVDPLPMAWWPLWDQRFAVTIHDSDITTTHRGWLDITEYGVVSVSPDAHDFFPASEETVRFLVNESIGWLVRDLDAAK